jgi:hypothetical protein
MCTQGLSHLLIAPNADNTTNLFLLLPASLITQTCCNKQ